MRQRGAARPRRGQPRRRPRRGGGCPAGCGLPLCANLEGHEVKSLVDIRSIDLGDSLLLEHVGGSVGNITGNFMGGCASATGFYRLIQNHQLAHEFLRIVEEGNQGEMFRYPGILRNVISPEETNAGALAAMDQYGLDALAVVGDDRRVKGIVEREHLMSKLLLSLVTDATGGRQ